MTSLRRRTLWLVMVLLLLGTLLIAYFNYRDSRHEGSFLVIHPSDGATLAAGIVR